MTWLVAGLALFLGIHLLPSFTGMRNYLINALDQRKYEGLFALVAFIGFILIVYGMANSDKSHVWTPPPWGKNLNAVLMLASMTSLAAAHMKTNLKRLTRHPMLWGVFFWSLAHILVNSESHVLLLCVSFGVYALVAMLSANLRGAQKTGVKVPVKHDAIVLGAGVVAYGVFLLLHPYLFGVSVW